MPEKTLKKLNKYMLPQWRACFFGALIVGLFAHFYKITNWLPNWDSLVFRYDSQNMITIGRWFLTVVCSFTSFYDLPFLNGIIAIIFHALGAVCITKTLRVEKNITAFLIGGVVVSFPTVTSVMMYNYVADGYAVAFFLSALSAMLMTDKKPKLVLSMLLISLSAGIYQAYITVTIMLVIFDLISRIIYNTEETKEILIKASKYLICGILGMGLYYVILKILLIINPVELFDYQGFNSSLSFSNIDLAGSLYSVKETFLKCFFDFSQGLNVYNFLNVVIFAFTILYYLKSVFKNKIYRNPLKLFILIVLCFMLILGASALSFINAGIDYHNLMLMGYCVFYLFFIVIYERGTNQDDLHSKIKAWAVFLVSLVLILNQIVIANVSYHKAQIAYEKSYGVLVRIADRIEQTPDTEKCDTVLVLGALKNSINYSANLPPDITGITDGYIIRKDDEAVGQSVLTTALNDYCDKNYSFLYGEEKEAFKKKDEIKAMPLWPQKDSVKVVDNIIVIKLGSE